MIVGWVERSEPHQVKKCPMSNVQGMTNNEIPIGTGKCTVAAHSKSLVLGHFQAHCSLLITHCSNVSATVALVGAATAPFRRQQVGPPTPVLFVACMTASGLTTRSVRRFRADRHAVERWAGLRKQSFSARTARPTRCRGSYASFAHVADHRGPIGLRVTARIPTKIAKACTNVKQRFWPSVAECARIQVHPAEA